MAFDLATAIGLKKMSNLDTGEMQEIKVALLDPNPNNFFPVEDDITDLCESIKLNGLLQPPVVTPSKDGRFRIIAGHRRHKALQALSEELPDKFGTVLCRVVRPSSPELEELMLIQTNTEAREIGWKEKNESAVRVEKILVALQKQGLELPGKMRSHVAKIIKTSESQIARAKFIAKNLIEPLRKRGLHDSLAHKLAHMPAEQQHELYEHYKSEPWRITMDSVKRYLSNVEDGRPHFDVVVRVRDCYVRPREGNKYLPCNHFVAINARKERDDLPDWQKCQSLSCCRACDYRFDCIDACRHCAAEIQEARKSEYFAIGQRLRAARENACISVEDAASAQSCDLDEIICQETVEPPAIGDLATLCRLYHCTPNQILGFERADDAPLPSDWTPAEQTGDLPDGLYFMLYEYNKPYVCEDGRPLVQTRAVLRRNGFWFLTPSGKPWVGCFGEEKLVAVLPAPPIPEAWSLMFETLNVTNEGDGFADV